MAKFLTTRQVSAQLEDVIKNAKERITLISPYLQIDDRLKRRIKSQADLGIKVHIIYRELQPKEEEWLDSVDSLRTSICEDLHAKCYFNENQALLTSMNLYQYSERNNYEMGVLISRDIDDELYQGLVEEAKHIIEDASTPVRDPRNGKKVDPPKLGFCIRCKETILANPTRPYCRNCFRKWNRNKDYAEKHCHLCGNEHVTSMSKPACLKCYRKYRNVLEFAVS